MAREEQSRRADRRGRSRGRVRRLFEAGRDCRSARCRCGLLQRRMRGGTRYSDFRRWERRSFGRRSARARRCVRSLAFRLSLRLTHAARQDSLSRIIFANFPTCIDANQHTASHSQIDVLIGFNSGDIVWMGALVLALAHLSYAEPKRHVRPSYRSLLALQQVRLRHLVGRHLDSLAPTRSAQISFLAFP